MNGANLVRLGVVWNRYGPGRLPGATRRNVGAGYACATAAVVATLLFSALTAGASILVGPDGQALMGLALLGLLALALVVPAAFGLGWLTWWALPDRTPYFGAVAGALTALLAYPVAALLLVGYVSVTGFDSVIPLGERLVGGVSTAILFGSVAFVLTVWVTLPVGAACGYLYEAVRTAS